MTILDRGPGPAPARTSCPGTPTPKDHPRNSPRQLITQLGRRLEALQTDHVDLFLIHGIGPGEYARQSLNWQPLGSTRRRGLRKATDSRTSRRIDVAAGEPRDGGTPAVHLAAANAPGVAATLAQPRVDAKADEHTAAPELPGVRPLRGRVVAADALFTRRAGCAKVTGGGDYVLPVTEDQPTRRADIEAAFAAPPAGLSPPGPRAAPGAAAAPLSWTRGTAGSSGGPRG